MRDRLQRERGEDLSLRLITPLIACQVLTSQPPILLLPFNPLLQQVRESHTVRHTRRQAIWSVTPIKQCTMVVLQELLKQPMATLMDGYTI